MLKKGAKALLNLVYMLLILKVAWDAHEVGALREEISAILSVSNKLEVMKYCFVLKSPGGMVHGYGLAAAQLTRLKR